MDDNKDNKEIKEATKPDVKGVHTVMIDLDGDGIPDGFYTSLSPHNNAIVMKEVKELKEEIKEFNIPNSIKLHLEPSATVSVEYNIADNKKIIFGASRVLKKREKYEEAHKELYMICLNSIKNLT